MNSQSPIPRIGTVSRRTVLEALALGVAVVPQRGWTAQPTKIRAIAFDAFPIFDPRSVVAAARGFFPEQGDRLAAVWSQKLFDYTWIDTAAGRYEDFEALAAEALRFAAQSLHLDLPAPVHQALVAKYSTLDIWPDVVPVLTRLKDAGIRMAFLSNMTEAMLRSNTRHAGLDRYFESPLSTDRVRKYKPSPSAYAMAIAAFGLPKDAIGFAAFGGWDAVGAGWFGYRTAWINRLGVPPERSATVPAIVSGGLEGVLQLAGVRAIPAGRKAGG